MSDQESTNDAHEPGLPGERLRQHPRIVRLRQHPRIVRLRQQVSALPVHQECRGSLFHSIDRYADLIIARPEYLSGEGRADLDVVQALAQADLNERNLMAWIELCRRMALEEI